MEPALKEQIHLAFTHIAPPPHAGPGDFHYFVAGRHWVALPVAGLFLHRKALATLPPDVFVAYIAAFMCGALVDGPYEVDLLAVSLAALVPEREALFDDAQRAAIARFRDYATDRMSQAGIRNYSSQRAPLAPRSRR